MTTTYVITPADDAGRMRAFSYTTEEQARLAATKNDYIIRGAGDVIWTGNALVEVYNCLTGKAVKKFESWPVGVKRLVDVLPSVAKPQQEIKTMMDGTDIQDPTIAAEREAAKTAKAEARAAKVAAREQAKAAKAAEREQAKAAKQQEREAAKAAKQQEREAAKAVKAEERAAEREEARAARAANGSTRRTREPIGEFKPVRRNSRLAMLINMAAEGATLGDMAKACREDFTEKDVVWWLRHSLRRDHGIDHKVEDGRCYLVLPPGKTLEDCVAASAK